MDVLSLMVLVVVVAAVVAVVIQRSLSVRPRRSEVPVRIERTTVRRRIR